MNRVRSNCQYVTGRADLNDLREIVCFKRTGRIKGEQGDADAITHCIHYSRMNKHGDQERKKERKKERERERVNEGTNYLQKS